MSKLIFTSFILISLLAVILVPVLASAQVGALVPCDGVGPDPNFTGPPTERNIKCDFAALMKLFDNLLKWMVWISVPLATVMMVYGGLLMITSPTSSEQRSHAKSIFSTALIGLIAILAAWLVIDTILQELTGQGVKARLSGNDVSTLLISNLT